MTTFSQWASADERRDAILQQLREQDRTSVADLSECLGVSEVTVRKDLDLLETQGLLTRIHGGAVASGRGRLELYFAAREKVHLEEKRRIAQAAAAMVRSRQSIFLDASTTALHIARLIKDREELIVVTNGLYTALELTFCSGIRVIVVGGMVRRRSSSLVGGLNRDLLERLRVDIGFFGAQGITARDGMTETDIDEAHLKQQMVAASTTVVGVADHSKFGEAHLSVFALPHEIDRVITDRDTPAVFVDPLRDRGIVVELV